MSTGSVTMVVVILLAVLSAAFTVPQEHQRRHRAAHADRLQDRVYWQLGHRLRDRPIRRILGGLTPAVRQQCVAGHLTQSLPYRFSVQVLLQILNHFRRVWYTSKYDSKHDSR